MLSQRSKVECDRAVHSLVLTCVYVDVQAHTHSIKVNFNRLLLDAEKILNVYQKGITIQLGFMPPPCGKVM